jgi:hypothetical protein
MDARSVHELVDRLAAVDDGCTDRGLVTVLLGDTQRLAAWVESRRLLLAGLIERCSSFPDDTVGTALRTSQREAARTLERAHVAAATPVFARALAVGDVSAQHLDVLGDGLRCLDPAQRCAVDTDRLAEAARRSTPEEFRRAVHREIDRVRTDDGMDRLEQQRRDTRLRTWISRDGMWNLSGRFDPATGLALSGRLRNELDRRFADTTPDTCPADPLEKQDHLRALALVSLTEGHGTSGLPEIVAVRDHRCTTCPICNPDLDPSPTLHRPHDPGDPVGPGGPSGPGGPGGPGDSDGSGSPSGPGDLGGPGGPAAPAVPTAAEAPAPVIDWGLDVELPAAYLDQLAQHARVFDVMVRDGTVDDPDGTLDQGRANRLANRSQRRALRALYCTCAIPGCSVRFVDTHIHHVIWWEHGGATDLHNLLPLCSRHHHAIHDSGWRLALERNRTLRIELPDGTTMTTGPPRRGAA